MSDDALRRAYQAHLKSAGGDAHSAAQRPAARASCPLPEVLAQLAEGDVATQLGTLDHVLQCQFCLAEFELMRTLARAGHDARLAEVTDVGVTQALAARDAPRLPAHRSARPSSRAWGGTGWAIAATVLVAVALGGTWWQQHLGNGEEGGAVVRGGDGGTVIVAPSGATADGTLVFTWRSVTGAAVGGIEARYVVEAFDSLGALVLSQTVRDTVYVPTAAEREALRRAQTFDWMVRADRGDGNERRSPLVRVRLGAPNGSPVR
ncbi:MAG: hypothetical protein IT359_04395 [Gemmatimonadaceae bacterium]|nr:hypothetical protein [Gemmatimonadaceae bacterium]